MIRLSSSHRLGTFNINGSLLYVFNVIYFFPL